MRSYCGIFISIKTFFCSRSNLIECIPLTQSYHFMANRWEKMETVSDFIFLGSKIAMGSDCRHKFKICLLLGIKAMTNLDSMLESTDINLLAKYSQSCGFSSSHVGC